MWGVVARVWVTGVMQPPARNVAVDIPCSALGFVVASARELLKASAAATNANRLFRRSDNFKRSVSPSSLMIPVHSLVQAT